MTKLGVQMTENGEQFEFPGWRSPVLCILSSVL